jgi:uncharacterized protein
MLHSSVLLLCALALLFGGADVFAQTSTDRAIPTLQGGTRVYDESNVLTPGEIMQLDAKLKAYEDSTSTQIVVVIINELGNNEISDYAIKVGRHNKVGQAKKNNGAIVLISQNPRRAWIATGMGLEASLTDLETGLIYREVLRPGLQAGNWYGTLDSTTSALMAATAGEFKADPRKTAPSADEPSGIGVIGFIVIFFVILTILRSFFGRGHRRTIVGSRRNNSGCGGGLMQGLLWSSIFNSMGSRGGGFSSGGFGGGGFGGGFGGGGGFSGGGGSFGGGGAGGSW